MVTRASRFPSRVAIGRVTVAGKEFLVYATPELSRALREVEESVDAVESGITALEISNVPSGSISSTNVQAALNELATEKLAISAVSAFIQTLLDDANAATARGTLGLGTISTQDADNVSITGGSVTTGTGAIGYSSGNGGTVTQVGGKNIGVTLNERFGEITLDGANLATGATVNFTFTNSTIAAEDYVHMKVSQGSQHAYSIDVREFNGGAAVNLKNITAADIAEPAVLRFYVFKGSLS